MIFASNPTRWFDDLCPPGDLSVSGAGQKDRRLRPCGHQRPPRNARNYRDKPARSGYDNSSIVVRLGWLDVFPKRDSFGDNVNRTATRVHGDLAIDDAGPSIPNWPTVCFVPPGLNRGFF